MQELVLKEIKKPIYAKSAELIDGFHLRPACLQTLSLSFRYVLC